MQNEKIDFAVHSLKDVPSQLADNLIIASIPKREKVNDVFISSDGSSLDKIKPGSVIGTSSLRRAVQVTRQRSDVTVKPIRGNIETRIKKISGETFDAVVLAQAGISRLGVDVNFTLLSTDDFSPSPGQGAIAIVARTDDSQTIEMLKKLKTLILDWKLRLNVLYLILLTLDVDSLWVPMLNQMVLK